VDRGYRVRLRPITLEELEEDVPIEWESLATQRVRSKIAARIEIEHEAAQHVDWQRPLERATAVLSLFGVGPVTWSRTEIGTESFVETAGAFPVVYRDSPPRMYAIKQGDAARLPGFWRVLSDAIPEHFYIGPQRPLVGLYGAFFNYLRVIESAEWPGRLVADVTRSLESLLLDGGPRDRIDATLQKRTSLLLTACGYDEDEVSQMVGIAYEVRSRVVHGANEFNARLQRRVETKAGGLVALLNRCLEYNRAALVAVLAAGFDEDRLRRAFERAAELQRLGRAFAKAEGRSGGRDGGGE
jgi:hypothetical protein